MWKISGADVEPLRNAAGDAFTHFVNALLFAHTRAAGIPRSMLHINYRTIVKDGGADALVDAPIPGDGTGVFDRPICLQFKTEDYPSLNKNDHAKLRKEIRKGKVVHECLKNGYGYCLMSCADLPPGTDQEWEALLTEECRKIEPTAPQARVITPSKLVSS